MTSEGIPGELQGKTFADFDLKLNPRMTAAVRQVQAVAAGEAWCALLCGAPGLGKSLLAACALQERYGHFWIWGALASRIQALTVGKGDERGNHHDEEDVLRPYQEGSFLLVLDDVGAEKQTDWKGQILYAILNARYLAKLPTIITTNNPTAIDQRVVSRYAVGAVDCEGVDVRLRLASAPR